jgi:lipopolysaccharide heptosyltransferase III
VTRAAPDRGCTFDWSRIRKVLLIRLRSIGDTVLMTACLDAFKRWQPDIALSVISEPLSAPILEHHPLVDELITIDRRLASRTRLISRLRRHRFDAAFNMHGGTTATTIAALSGAAMTAGFAGHRQSWMLSCRAPDPDLVLGRDKIHSVEQQLALLSWCGVPMPEQPRLSLRISDQARSSVRQRLSSLNGDSASPKSFALISPGAALESKSWRRDGFAAVADHLHDRWGLRSIVVAGPDQETIARDVARLARSGPAIVSGLSLAELMALVEMSAILICNDSGPMHVAAALERPIVAIFGSSNPDVWRPWTEAPNRVIAPANRTSAIKQIPDEEVIVAADEMMTAVLAVPGGTELTA